MIEYRELTQAEKAQVPRLRPAQGAVGAVEVSLLADEARLCAGAGGKGDGLPVGAGGVLVTSVGDHREIEGAPSQVGQQLAAGAGAPVNGLVGARDVAVAGEGDDLGVGVALAQRPEKAGEVVGGEEADGEEAARHRVSPPGAAGSGRHPWRAARRSGSGARCGFGEGRAGGAACAGDGRRLPRRRRGAPRHGPGA